MRKTILGLSIILVLSAIFQNCKRCEPIGYPIHFNLVPPDSEDVKWAVYNDGQNVILKDNQGEFDTLVVTRDTLGFNTPGSDNTTCDVYTLYQRYAMHLTEKGFTKVDATFSLFTATANKSYAPYAEFYLNGWCNGQPQGTGTELKDAPALDSFLVSGYYYHNVYEFEQDSTTLDTTYHACKVWRVYLNQEKGLLRFDLLGGKYWELVE